MLIHFKSSCSATTNFKASIRKWRQRFLATTVTPLQPFTPKSMAIIDGKESRRWTPRRKLTSTPPMTKMRPLQPRNSLYRTDHLPSSNPLSTTLMMTKMPWTRSNHLPRTVPPLHLRPNPKTTKMSDPQYQHPHPLHPRPHT